MEHTNIQFQISVSQSLYLKNPETSFLGKKIIQHSVLLIDKIGFELFTFKKLAESIQSTESSIYRYFENKHKLLLYLSAWYWGWIEYNLVLNTINIENPITKLENGIKLVTQGAIYDAYASINTEILHNIIVSEFIKTFLTKNVDQENTEGCFKGYKRVILKMVTIISTVNPKYPFSKTLATTIVEGALHHEFVKKHFITITDFNQHTSVTNFYIDLAKKTLL